MSLQATSCVGEGVRVRSSRADIKSRLRPEVPERRSMRLMANDEKALDSYFSAFFDDDDGDDEYLPIEDWKQVLERARGGGRITVAFVDHVLLL